MQNFSSLACTQTDLDTFLSILEENFRIFQKNSLTNPKQLQTGVSHFIPHLAKHVHAKFKLSSFYPAGLRQIFDIFSRKNQDFLIESLELSKSE
jgi:hypothetical protein